MQVNKMGMKTWISAALFAMTLGSAQASVTVGGVKLDESASVAGKDLVLNGAGIRSKFVIRVYVAALYLPNKENTTENVLKAPGPRRMRLVMLRDVGSDDFSEAFMNGLTKNLSVQDRARIASQISKYGEMFAQFNGLKKGDILDTDWIPGQGSQAYLNGKKVGEVLPDISFYNATLRIWLGDKPVQDNLKVSLLTPVVNK